jgi:hypothetical protein
MLGTLTSQSVSCKFFCVCGVLSILSRHSSSMLDAVAVGRRGKRGRVDIRKACQEAAPRGATLHHFEMRASGPDLSPINDNTTPLALRLLYPLSYTYALSSTVLPCFALAKCSRETPKTARNPLRGQLAASSKCKTLAVLIYLRK